MSDPELTIVPSENFSITEKKEKTKELSIEKQLKTTGRNIRIFRSVFEAKKLSGEEDRKRLEYY